jgi:DNA helicase II / ATP-dependent DNA helicase PcrA
MTRRINSPDTPADLALRQILDGPASTSFIMNAGAGSGKTTTLVKGLAHLRYSRSTVLRERSQKIACITYTEVAAAEIHSEIDDDPLFHVSTIHSFLWSVISPFKRDIANWVSRRIDEKIAILLEHNTKPRTQARTIEKNNAQMERLQADKLSLTSVAHFTYGVGSRYSDGVLGHDDIIKMVPQLILEKPLLRRLIAKQFPVVFVDESQDTTVSVVEALKAIDSDPLCDITVGFFGDPMQQIYVTGIGDILPGPGWGTIDKPENFRCPTEVLDVINNIRREVAGSLLQVGGRTVQSGDALVRVEGHANLFILPLDGDRDQLLQRVQQWLATTTDDPQWAFSGSESSAKILVIEHRLAARRLGFESLYSALHDKSTDELKNGVGEGTAWPTSPFVTYLTRLALASKSNQQYAITRLLIEFCPAMRTVEVAPDAASTLFELATAVSGFAELMSPTSGASVLDAIQFAVAHRLVELDDRFAPYFPVGEGDEASARPTDDVVGNVIERYFAVPAKELVNYQSYLNEHSVYSTHQGVKGAEFERVLLLLEDDAARGNGFSYDKLLGLKALSEDDQKHVAAGDETIVDKTRRLFYVCCSRAEHSLAVVLFAADPASAKAALIAQGVFRADQVWAMDVLPELTPTSS